MNSYFVKVPKWARLVYPRAIWSLKNEEYNHKRKWTIDDGPHPVSTPLWLELFNQKNIKATFFLIGQKCADYPQLVNEIISEGHEIGSHGYAHLDGWRTSTHDYIEDFKKSLETMETQFFRPPYGRMTPFQYARICSLSKIIMWSLMPGDFDKDVDEELLNDRIHACSEQDIIVLHDNPVCFDKSKRAFEFVSS